MRSETSGDAALRLRVEIAVAGACVMRRHHAAMGFTIAGLVLRIGFDDSQKAHLHEHRMAASGISVKIFLLPKVATRSPCCDDLHRHGDSAPCITRDCHHISKCRMLLRHSRFLKY